MTNTTIGSKHNYPICVENLYNILNKGWNSHYSEHTLSCAGSAWWCCVRSPTHTRESIINPVIKPLLTNLMKLL